MSINAYRVQTVPDTYAPFKISQAVEVGDLIFVSGQASIGKDGHVIGAGNFDEQAACTFRNLEWVLKAADSDLSKVIKVNIYLTNMSNFSKIIDLREKYFTSPYPADTIVEVSALALPELEIEIEAIALKDGMFNDT
tara:strand:- start:61 stop:471 length:411 start_codon:yes stop_codon:yes gene_type:complete